MSKTVIDSCVRGFLRQGNLRVVTGLSHSGRIDVHGLSRPSVPTLRQPLTRNINVLRRNYRSVSALWTRHVICSLLETIDNMDQVHRYLRTFANMNNNTLAVMAIDDKGLEDTDFSFLAMSIAILIDAGRNLVILHGRSVSEPSSDESQSPLTSHETDAICYKTPGQGAGSTAFNEALTQALEEAGISVRPIAHPIFTNPSSPSIMQDHIDSAFRHGYLPLIPALGITEAGRVFDFDLAKATLALSRALKPEQVMLLPQRYWRSAIPVANAPQKSANNDSEMSIPTVVPESSSYKVSESISAISRLLESTSSIFMGNLENVQYSLAAGIHGPTSATDFTVVRRRCHFQTSTSVWKLTSLSQIKSILRRHWQSQGWENASNVADRLILQLRNRKFVAYYDEGPTESLAIVFLDSRLHWRGCKLGRSGMVELAVFAVSSQGWKDEIAEELWRRICADHDRIWGTIKKGDLNWEWWLKKAQGSLRRGDETDIWTGELVTADFELDIEEEEVVRPFILEHAAAAA